LAYPEGLEVLASLAPEAAAEVLEKMIEERGA
jgi:hypothetical protein